VITVKEIVKEWLKQNGYEGLCNGDYDCGCTLDTLMECGEVSEWCEAAHKGKPPEQADGFNCNCGESDAWMYPGKKGGGA